VEFNKEDLEKILEIRKSLVLAHEGKKDYISNKSAIMKESDHIVLLERTIKKIDNFLSKYVQFG